MMARVLALLSTLLAVCAESMWMRESQECRGVLFLGVCDALMCGLAFCVVRVATKQSRCWCTAGVSTYSRGGLLVLFVEGRRGTVTAHRCLFAWPHLCVAKWGPHTS